MEVLTKGQKLITQDAILDQLRSFVKPDGLHAADIPSTLRQTFDRRYGKKGWKKAAAIIGAQPILKKRGFPRNTSQDKQIFDLLVGRQLTLEAAGKKLGVTKQMMFHHVRALGIEKRWVEKS